MTTTSRASTGYKLYQDPDIRKTLRKARKLAEIRKVQDWRAKHVKNYRRVAHAK